jgi:hypothetical protein
VFIFVRKDHCFNKIDIYHFCKEQNLEIYANQLEIETTNLVILSLYRAPSDDLSQFLRTLGTKSEFLIWGDISMDYLNENNTLHQKWNNVTSNIQFIIHCKFCNKNLK